jgi:hypothetical protein
MVSSCSSLPVLVFAKIIEIVALDSGHRSYMQLDPNLNACQFHPHATAKLFFPHSTFSPNVFENNVHHLPQEGCVRINSDMIGFPVERAHSMSPCHRKVSPSLQLRGGGKAKAHRDAPSPSRISDDPTMVTAGKELTETEKKTASDRGSRERSAMLSELVAGMDVDDHSSTRKLSIQRVEQLRMALAKKDKAAISTALEKVSCDSTQIEPPELPETEDFSMPPLQIAAAARKEFAPKIWKVKPLATDGLAVGGR